MAASLASARVPATGAWTWSRRRCGGWNLTSSALIRPAPRSSGADQIPPHALEQRHHPADGALRARHRLLDIEGKRLGVPVWRLLGGSIHPRFRNYYSHWDAVVRPASPRPSAIKPLRRRTPVGPR